MPNVRKITDHRLTTLDRAIELIAVDEPSAETGGASHVYEMRITTGRDGVEVQRVRFQQGAIGSPNDINGTSNEAVLAIVIDRLRGFQGHLANQTGVAANFACRENALALTDLESALNWLRKRTLDRLARGVEGKPVQ